MVKEIRKLELVPLILFVWWAYAIEDQSQKPIVQARDEG